MHTFYDGSASALDDVSLPHTCIPLIPMYPTSSGKQCNFKKFIIVMVIAKFSEYNTDVIKYLSCYRDGAQNTIDKMLQVPLVG